MGFGRAYGGPWVPYSAEMHPRTETRKSSLKPERTRARPVTVRLT